MKLFVSPFYQRFKGLSTILTVLVVMSLFLVVWGGSATSAAASTHAPALGLKKAVVHVVTIIEKHHIYYFQPASLKIRVGDVVVWKNASDAPHTVTSNTGVFNTKGFLMHGQKFTRTFSLGGTFKYHCNVHPYMHGMIIVVP